MCLACFFAPVDHDPQPRRRTLMQGAGAFVFGRRAAASAASALIAETVFAPEARATEPNSDHLIFVGGDIITMAGPEAAYVEAIVVEAGRIAFLGSRAEAMRLRRATTQVIDLGGRTLLPGFIDAHGHMVYYGKNLADASLRGVADIPELVRRMQAHLAQAPGEGWIVGMGYDPLKMPEKRHPTAAELDAISPDRPVLVVHASGHGGSMNHAMMRALGIDEKTPDPQGGEYVRAPGGKTPLGPMEEVALIDVRNRRPPFEGADADRVFTAAAAVWARNGQTTAMECGLGLGADDVSLVLRAIERKLLPIDLVVFAKDDKVDEVTKQAYGVGQAYGTEASGTAQKLRAVRPDMDGRYVNRVRLGGAKFWLDGNPVLAWMSKPFAVPPPGRDTDFHGYSQITDEVLFKAFDEHWTTPFQINMHLNGDEAVEQALRAIEAAVARHGMRDHRPVFVHCAYVRPDQIARMKALGAIPSFLTISLFNQGDDLAPIFGAERMATTNATASMQRAGIPFTLSHDAPVTPPEILPLVWAATQRTTQGGQVLAPEQRIDAYTALRAVTADAAFQIREETTKGTLEVGKLADFVVLDRNPLKIPAAQIRDIAVVQTIKEGRAVFTA